MKKKKINNGGGIVTRDVNVYEVIRKFAEIIRYIAIVALIVAAALAFCGCSTRYSIRKKYDYVRCKENTVANVIILWPPDMVPHPHFPEPKPRDPRIPVA